jgi:hypothetical protein
MKTSMACMKYHAANEMFLAETAVLDGGFSRLALLGMFLLNLLLTIAIFALGVGRSGFAHHNQKGKTAR